MMQQAFESGNIQVTQGESQVIDLRGSGLRDQIMGALEQHGIDPQAAQGAEIDADDVPGLQDQIMQALQDAGVDVGRLGNGAEELTIEGGRTRAPTPTPAPTRAKPVPEKGEIGRGERFRPASGGCAAAFPGPASPIATPGASRGRRDRAGRHGLRGRGRHPPARVRDGAGRPELAGARLLVCTHAHSDHYGLAGPIMDAAGCELWMHPPGSTSGDSRRTPTRRLDRRIEVARQSGVPAGA